MDFAYIQAQTFGDRALEAELLQLFRDQARRLIPGLPHRTIVEAADAAHLLKGSARAVGALATAAALERFEAAEPEARRESGAAFAMLLCAFAEDEAAITERLTVPG